MLIRKVFIPRMKFYALDFQLNSTGGCNAVSTTAVFLWMNVSVDTKVKGNLFRIGAFY
jgi:hypothetical protein